jgi:uncharacterized protein YciI
MFIITLTYVKPIAEVDRFLQEHRDFLRRRYATGHLLMSGPQNPRTGGVIVAQAPSRTEVEAIFREDPFYREQVAEYEFIEFAPVLTAPALAEYQVN